MMQVYRTADSRLAAFLLANGLSLSGTELTFHGDEDRVYLLFNVDEDKILELKRAFFEGASSPALALLNFSKSVMFHIRECRELARESKQR
jgi:hypothetical protein